MKSNVGNDARSDIDLAWCFASDVSGETFMPADAGFSLIPLFWSSSPLLAFPFSSRQLVLIPDLPSGPVLFGDGGISTVNVRKSFLGSFDGSAPYLVMIVFSDRFFQ